MHESLSIDKLKEKILEDLPSVNKVNVHEEIQSSSIKYHRYLSLLYEEKNNRDRLKEIKDKLYKKLYHYYRFEYDHKLNERGKEISTYISGHDKMLEIQKNINIINSKIEYLEGVIDIFKQRSFSFKNIVDLMKLESQGCL